ncbi:hypothetical protein LguiB_023540 [Lonicera macranthoides]
MPLSPVKKPHSWPEHWFKDQQKALKHVVLRRRINSNTPPSETDEALTPTPTESPIEPTEPDYTSLLSDEQLLIVLSKLPESQQIANCLVCKRWLRISGRLVRSIKVLDWEFLESGRLVYRFPNLNEVDVVRACISSPRNSGIMLSNKYVEVHLCSQFMDGGFIRKQDLLESDVIDKGVSVLAQGCPNMRKLGLNGVTEKGLSCVAEECRTLQELELHGCTDWALTGVTRSENLQILKLIGRVDGFYDSVITDIGLTILAQGCRRLVKLELVGCEGSYDGIKAIGQCCQMLEELTLCDHRLDGGWLAALSYCGNLKTLKLQSCKIIDSSPGPDEHLGSCPTLEELHLQRCQMRDMQGVRALFVVCQAVRELVLEDCWGLDNNIFGTASICRRLRYLSLEGCSLLTMEGLESVVLSFKELKRLRVVSCNKVKDIEVTPSLANLFCVLKELKWRPDSRSLLESALAGTGVGQKGGRSFRKN